MILAIAALLVNRACTERIAVENGSIVSTGSQVGEHVDSLCAAEPRSRARSCCQPLVTSLFVDIEDVAAPQWYRPTILYFPTKEMLVTQL